MNELEENKERNLEQLALASFNQGVAKLKNLERYAQNASNSSLVDGISGLGHLQMASYYLLRHIIENNNANYSTIKFFKKIENCIGKYLEEESKKSKRVYI